MGQAFGSNNQQQVSFEEQQSISKILEGFSTLLQIHNTNQVGTIQQISQRLEKLEKRMDNLQYEFNQFKYNRTPSYSQTNYSTGQSSYPSYPASNMAYPSNDRNSNFKTMNSTSGPHQYTLPNYNRSTQPQPVMQPQPIPIQPEAVSEIIFVTSEDDLLGNALVEQLEKIFAQLLEPFTSSIPKNKFLFKKTTLEDLSPENGTADLKQQLVVVVSMRRADSREINLNLENKYSDACQTLSNRKFSAKKVNYLFLKFQNYISQSAGDASDYSDVSEISNCAPDHFLRLPQVIGFVEIPFSMSSKKLYNSTLPPILSGMLLSLFQ